LLVILLDVDDSIELVASARANVALARTRDHVVDAHPFRGARTPRSECSATDTRRPLVRGDELAAGRILAALREAAVHLCAHRQHGADHEGRRQFTSTVSRAPNESFAPA
jgi:hypothetical protein